MPMFEVGAFRVGDGDRVVYQGGQIVPLPPKAVDVLIELLRNAGTVVRREALIEAVWPGTFVQESNLTQMIFLLRRALRNAPGSGRIATAPRRGYSFVGEVRSSRIESPIHAEVRPHNQLRFPAPSNSGLALCARAPAPDGPSVAVLPFADLSPSGDYEWLTDRLAEDILNAVSRAKGIRVAARTSSFRFKGHVADLVEIGRLLQVDVIVKGSLCAFSDRFRVTVHLVQVADGFSIWSEHLDRHVDDMNAAQDQISTGVLAALRDRFGIDLPRDRHGTPPASGRAYVHYVKGRFWWNRRDACSVRKAISCFAQATEDDPGSALAFSGMADAHSSLAYFGSEDPKPHAQQSREFARRAAAMTPDLPEVQGSLGLASWMALDVGGTVAHYRRAVELDQCHASALYQYGSVLGALRRIDEALECCDRALDIEPLLLPALTWRGMILHLGGHHEESVRQFRDALEFDPNLFRALVEQVFPLVALGRWREALDALSKAESLFGEHPRVLALRGNILGSQGERAAATALLARLNRLEERTFVSGFDRALVWLGLGDLERSMADLDRSYEQQYAWLLFAGTLPLLAPLRHHSWFLTLLGRLKLETA
ncbi:MAG: winged helix-turn-helix domain-containing protein [Acidobacteria bacterium]|nr:winged helix-turn-helix domain-containing protein [Acidobacteriota bacterium]